MAAEFQGTQTTLQPTALEQPIQTNVFDQGASVFDQAAAGSVQQANVQGVRADTLFNKAGAAFEQAYSTYNKYAEQKAIEDAPAAIKYDGNHNIIPPSSFYPPGISMPGYAEPYRKATQALYNTYAEQELQGYSNEMRTKFPTNPEAYAAAMATKQRAMQVNLAPEAAPWIDLRSQQITSQGVSQIAVFNQSAANDELKLQTQRKLDGIRVDARGIAVNTPQAQGGGGTVPAFDNNTGNITNTGEQYAGGKGLPYLAPSGLKFETFESPEQGVAASYQLVKNKVDAAGGMTFNELISGKGTVKGWDAGAPGLNKANYATAMAKAAGLKPDDQVPIGDGAAMAKILKAQNIFEKGKQTAPDIAFENGVRLGSGDKTVPLTVTPNTVAIAADPKALADAATTAVNAGTIQKRLAEFDAMAGQAGYSPDWIKRQKDDLIFDTQLGAMQEQIKNSASQLYNADGTQKPGAIADAQDRIRQIAAKYPEREKQVIDGLNSALDFAAQQASRRASQIQVDDQRAVLPKQRDMAKLTADAQAARDAGDTDGAAFYTHKLEQMGRSYLNDSTLSDKVAMTLAQSAFANGSVSRGAMQESFNNRLQSLNAIASSTDPFSATPQMKAQAEAEMKAIRNDPHLMGDLTASQRSYLQSGLDLFSSKRLAADTAGLSAAAATGDIGSPSVAAAIMQQRAAAGIDGNHPGAQLTLPQQAQILAVNAAAYNAKQTTAEQARNAVQTAATGGTPSGDDQAAVNKLTPLRLPGSPPDLSDPAHGLALGAPNQPNVPDFNPAMPGHKEAVAAFQRTNGFVPPAAKDAVAAMSLSSNQATMQPWFDFYKQTYNIASDRIFKRTGQRPTDSDLRAETATLLGDDNKANLLAIGVRNGELGAETMYRTATNPKGSVTANTGQPTGAASTAMDGATNEYTNEIIANGPKSIAANKLLNFRIPGTAGWQPTPAELTAMKAYGSGSQTAPGTAESLTGMSVWGKTMPPSVKMNGEADALIKQRAGDLYARDGDVLRHGNNSGSPEGYAYKTIANRMFDNGELEMTRDPNDPNVGVIGLKTANKAIADKMGMDRFNDATTNAFFEQLWRADAKLGVRNPDGTMSEKMLPDIDPKSVYVEPYVNAQGQSYWFVGANEKRTGQRLKLMDLPQNDPRFDAATMAMDRSAMLTMQKNLVGPDGKPVDPGVAASAAIAFSRFAQTPFQSVLRQHYAEGAVLSPQDHKAFTEELNRNLVEIRNQQGLSSVDWEKSLKNIANDQTPDDGRNGMLREIARQESAKQEAQRTGKPVPPPATTNPIVLPPSQPNNTGPDAQREAAERAAAESAPNKRGR